MFSRDSASFWVQVFVLIGLVCLASIAVQQRNEIRRLLHDQVVTQQDAASTSGIVTTSQTTTTQKVAQGEPHPVDFTCDEPAKLLPTSVRTSLDKELDAAGWLTTKEEPSAYVCVKPNQMNEPILAITNNCSDNGPCSFEVIQMFDPISKTLSPIVKEPTSEIISAGLVISKILSWNEREVRYRTREAFFEGGCAESELARIPWYTDKVINLSNYQETVTRRCYQKSCAAANVDSPDLRCE